MPEPTIPTVDLSAFFTTAGGADAEAAREKAKAVISQACSEYGFFQMVNHGVPLDLMTRALELSKTFYEFSEDEKLKCCYGPGAPLPSGYVPTPKRYLPEQKEYYVIYPPGSRYNIFPAHLPQFREVMEEIFKHFAKTSQILESILNECLGFPRGYLREYNNDRSCDVMILRHLPASDYENTAVREHQDGNCITFVVQDDVGGLEVEKDGQWIPIAPREGTIVVNISDVLQVLSNKKLKSATHRVLRQKGKSRHSCVFFYSIGGDKWVEPLPEFAEKIGERSRYRGFYYSEYLALRVKNKTDPPARFDDFARLTDFEIPNVDNKA